MQVYSSFFLRLSRSGSCRWRLDGAVRQFRWLRSAFGTLTGCGVALAEPRDLHGPPEGAQMLRSEGEQPSPRSPNGASADCLRRCIYWVSPGFRRPARDPPPGSDRVRATTTLGCGEIVFGDILYEQHSKQNAHKSPIIVTFRPPRQRQLGAVGTDDLRPYRPGAHPYVSAVIRAVNGHLGHNSLD
jgi:hypothetical protein